MKKVFLGGTVDSKWREKLIPLLKIKYFNPIVPDWTDEAYEEELKQREICDYLLYVITPKMTGVYSIAEVVDDSNKFPEKTLFCFLTKDEDEKFTKGQIKSLVSVAKMVRNNGANLFLTLESIANFLNDDNEK